MAVLITKNNRIDLNICYLDIFNLKSINFGQQIEILFQLFFQEY